MSVYDQGFYGVQSSGSEKSAQRILPIVIDYLGRVESLVDVGGGVGTWSAVALEVGVTNVTLLDGPWAKDAGLRIAPDSFMPWDLERRLPDALRADLAVCLEVAEHLSKARAQSLVSDLCAISDVILFSAAIPGQGGTNHINERWLSDWAAEFDALGFGMVDIIRTQVWNDADVDWWYAQNAVLFRRGFEQKNGPVDIVHPRAWLDRVDRLTRLMRPVETIRPLARRLPTSVKKRIAYYF